MRQACMHEENQASRGRRVSEALWPDGSAEPQQQKAYANAIQKLDTLFLFPIAASIHHILDERQEYKWSRLDVI